MITILNNSSMGFSKIRNIIQSDGSLTSKIEVIAVGFNTLTPNQFKLFENDKFFKLAVERGEIIVNGNMSDVKEVEVKEEIPKSPVEQVFENMKKPIEVATKKKRKKKKADVDFKDFD